MNNISILNAIGINEYIEDKDEVVADCILCGEVKKNLQINFKKKIYHCWVCDSGGKIARLVADIRGITQQEANKLFNLDEIDIDYELQEIQKVLEEDKQRVYTYKRYEVQDRYKYWKRRKINSKSVRDFHLGLDLFTNRLVIPVISQNRCVALIRRALSNSQVPKYIYSKGFRKTKILYGYDSINLQKDNIVIAEGAIDTIRLRQLGFNAIGLLGVNLHKAQLEIITRDFDQVILALDNDQAGHDGMLKMIPQLEPFANLYHLIYSEDDPGAIKNMAQIKRVQPITLL